MAWIKTISPKDSEAVREAALATRALYPAVYGAAPSEHLPPSVASESIVLSHSLIPDLMRHAFSTLAAAMTPDLPLSRREHELIAATVSAINACFY